MYGVQLICFGGGGGCGVEVVVVAVGQFNRENSTARTLALALFCHGRRFRTSSCNRLVTL